MLWTLLYQMDLGRVRCWPCFTLPICALPTTLCGGPRCNKWWRCSKTLTKALNCRRSAVCEKVSKPKFECFFSFIFAILFPSRLAEILRSGEFVWFVLNLISWGFFFLQDHKVTWERWYRTLNFLVLRSKISSVIWASWVPSSWWR